MSSEEDRCDPLIALLSIICDGISTYDECSFDIGCPFR
jgi:hypothetical protein